MNSKCSAAANQGEPGKLQRVSERERRATSVSRPADSAQGSSVATSTLHNAVPFKAQQQDRLREIFVSGPGQGLTDGKTRQ